MQVVCDPAEADFILAHGTEAVGLQDGSTQDMSLQQLFDLLQQCADVARQRGKELPMVVANPDLVGTGQGDTGVRAVGHEQWSLLLAAIASVSMCLLQICRDL